MTRTAGALTLTVMFTSLAAAGQTSVGLRGRVVVEGQTPVIPPLQLVVVHRRMGVDERLALLRVSPKGDFDGEVRLLKDAALLLVPSNTKAFLGQGTLFFLGGCERAAGEKGALKMSLRPLSPRKMTLSVRGPEDRPMAHRPVQCSAAYIITIDGTRIARRCEWKDQTDAKGELHFPAFKGLDALYEFSLVTRSAAGKLQTKVFKIANAKLPNGNKPVTWHCNRRSLSLQVKLKWDESFAKEPFVLIAGVFHAVALKEVPHSEIATDNSAVARFYDLKPGTYTAALGQVLSGHYRVTGGRSVQIEKGANLPVRHTVFVMPRNPAMVRAFLAQIKALRPANLVTREGMLLDASNGKPVVGAEVKSPAEKLKTNRFGCFRIRSPKGSTVSLGISHPAYYPLAIPLPREGGVMVQKFEMKPYPVFSGKVIFARTRKPLKDCEIFLLARDGGRVRADGFGRFSLRAKPGKCVLQISAVVDLEAFGKFPFGKEQLAVVYRDLVTIPKTGLKREFRVPEVACLAITLGITPAALKIDRPTYLGLVRPADNMEMGAHRPAYVGKALTCYVGAGEYRIMIASSQGRVTFVSKVEAKAGKTIKVSANVEKWMHYYSCDRQGRVKLQEKPPAESRSIRDSLKPVPVPMRE